MDLIASIYCPHCAGTYDWRIDVSKLEELQVCPLCTGQFLLPDDKLEEIKELFKRQSESSS